MTGCDDEMDDEMKDEFATAWPFPDVLGRRYAFELLGAQWCSNGHIALRLPAPVEFDGSWRRVGKLDWAATHFVPTHRIEVTQDGTDVYDYGGVMLSRRYVDAVESAFPGASPRFAPDALAPVFWYRRGEPVAVVMPVRSPPVWETPKWVEAAHDLAKRARYAIEELERAARAAEAALP